MSYSPGMWALVFFVYGCLGWCFETGYVSLCRRHMVNRGFLRGPFLPIYGTGALLLLYTGRWLHQRPVALFLAAMAVATVFEYVVGAVMERWFKIKYWDYSGHRFQLHGRICLQSSLCWGAMGLLLTYWLHPLVERALMRVPAYLSYTLVAVLISLLIADAVLSVRAALALAQLLVVLDAQHARGQRVRSNGQGHVYAGVSGAVSRHLLRGNPSAYSAQYNDILQQLKREAYQHTVIKKEHTNQNCKN